MFAICLLLFQQYVYTFQYVCMCKVVPISDLYLSEWTKIGWWINNSTKSGMLQNLSFVVASLDEIICDLY